MFDNIDSHKGTTSLFLNSEWLTYLSVVAISIWGGLVKYMSNKENFSWRSLVAAVMSSSFAGMMVLLACQYAGITGPIVGVMCGISGHLGTPALIKLASKLKIVRDALGAEVTKDVSA